MTYNLNSFLRPARRPGGGVAWLFACAAAALTAACGGSPPDGGAPAAGGGRGAMPPMPVEIVQLTLQPVEESVEYVGVIKSRRSTTIQPQAEGILTRILVSSGDRVAAGTPMFEIDAAAQQAGLASLQSVRAARQADAALAAQQAQRAQSLLDVGATSQQELEQATTGRQTADAQLTAVEEQIRQLQAELAYYRVTAPTGGVVGDIPNRVGDRVTKATELTVLHDNTGLEVYLNVPLSQSPQLRTGLPVRLVDDEGNTIATERVSFVAPAVDEETQTVLVKAPVAAGGGRFRTDQFVRARVVFSTTPGLTVPLVSVMRIGGQYFVYVAEPAGGGLVARQRPVDLGQVIGNEYVVRSGLSAGERLVVSGIQKIGDGAPVAEAPPGPPPGAPAGPARGGQS